MGDVRKLMARLNPTTVRYDIGSGGGVPELTAQDVAAALAFVPQGIGREMFCLLWWPDGASGPRWQLNRACDNLLLKEIHRRAVKLNDARCEMLDFEVEHGHLTTLPHYLKAEHHRLAVRIEQAKQDAWPRNAAKLIALRTAVLLEISSPTHCGKCQGRATVMSGELMVNCDRCEGKGVVAATDYSRAASLGISQPGYIKTWRAPYEWLIGILQGLEIVACKQMSDALK